MRSAARLQRYGAPGLTYEEIEQLATGQLPAEDHRTALIGAVGMKNVLGDIQTNCDSLRHGRLLSGESTPPFWHIDAVGGRPPHQVCLFSRPEPDRQGTTPKPTLMNAFRLSLCEPYRLPESGLWSAST
jgi:hypothetical protein